MKISSNSNYNKKQTSFGTAEIIRNSEDLFRPFYDNLEEKRALKQLVKMFQQDPKFKTAIKKAPDNVKLRFFADEKTSGDIFLAKIGKDNEFQEENVLEVYPLNDIYDKDRFNIVKSTIINLINKVSNQ